MPDTVASQSAASPADTKASPLLRAVGVSKTYAMGRAKLRVLTQCDLTVPAGEFVAIMGKSGSGKSTLLHILGALDVPDEGQVVFRGQDVFAPAAYRRYRPRVLDMFNVYEKQRNRLRRTAFGFVFQFYHLLPELNVLENVVLPHMVANSVLEWSRNGADAREQAREMLDRVGLAERLKHRPAELSGGERQRVALARALVHKPAVLLADEPTGNLDAEAGGNIMHILADLHRDGQTIVMVTHDPSIAEYADRVLTLDRGALRAR